MTIEKHPAILLWEIHHQNQNSLPSVNVALPTDRHLFKACYADAKHLFSGGEKAQGGGT